MNRIEKLCVEKGMRMTEQRRVIAARAVRGPRPSRRRGTCTAAPHAVDPHISIATVYRTVRLFEEAGIITRHDSATAAPATRSTPNTTTT